MFVMVMHTFYVGNNKDIEIDISKFIFLRRIL